jgi:hypothetical protein
MRGNIIRVRAEARWLMEIVAAQRMRSILFKGAATISGATRLPKHGVTSSLRGRRAGIA